MEIAYIRNSRLKQENSISTQKQLIADFCDNQNIRKNDQIKDTSEENKTLL